MKCQQNISQEYLSKFLKVTFMICKCVANTTVAKGLEKINLHSSTKKD